MWQYYMYYRVAVLRETQFGCVTYKLILKFYVKHKLALLSIGQGGSLTCNKLL